MSINEYGLYPLNYTIAFCSSSDPGFPIENINKKSRYSDFVETNLLTNNQPINSDKYKKIYFNPGWSSLRFCSYPQIIIAQLSSISDIKQINIELNHERVPQKIDVYIYCPTVLKEVVTNFKNIINAKFTYIGSTIPVNHNNNQRELKKLIFHNEGNYGQVSLMNCLYVKFVVHKNYLNEKNKFNQVGIINIDIFGNHYNKILPIFPLKQIEPFKLDEIIPRLKGLYTDDDYDNYIKEKIEKAKMEYYNNEIIMKNEEKRDKIYQDITLLRELGCKVIELNKEKTKFEYLNNNIKIMQVNSKLKEIKDYIEQTFPYYGKENIKYDNDINFDKNIQDNEYTTNIVEENLNESNNNISISNNNINNISENNNNLNEQEDDKIYINDNNNNNNTSEINNENINEKYKINEVSERSKEILRRHQEKQRMIRENMEIAEQNRQRDKIK
jgi:hypothetical protein